MLARAIFNLKNILFDLILLPFFGITIAQAEQAPQGFELRYVQETPVDAQAPKVIHRIECSCIQWALDYLGRESQQWGIPNRIRDLSSEPRIGGLVVTTESRPGTNTGHIAVIEGIIGETLFLKEANYVPCKVTTRTLNIHDPIIRGFKD